MPPPPASSVLVIYHRLNIIISACFCFKPKQHKVMSVLEGSSNKRQRAWAWADPPHIVVGNPENLSRLVTTGAVRVNAVSYVVVDEVDACLLSEGTRSWLHELLARSLSPTHADEQDREVSRLAGTTAVAHSGRITLTREARDTRAA